MITTRYWIFLSVALFISVTNICAQYYEDEETDSTCTTPNGEAAECVSIRDCSVLRAVLSNRSPDVQRFLRASQCQHPDSRARNPFVCCGSASSYNTGGSTTRLGGAGGSGVLPTGDDCGYQKADDRILGGNRTSLEEFPWMAILQYRKNNGQGFTFSCGGTIIGPKYILTAAHCVKGVIITTVGRLSIVRLGEWDLNTDSDCFENTLNGRKFKECSDPVLNAEYEDIIVHEEYQDQPRTKRHDIALVRLKEPLPFTDYIRPICLPPPTSNPNVGDQLYVAGWGRTEFARFSSKKLKLIVPLVGQEQCSASFGHTRITIWPTHICAGGKSGEDSCQGDSGGPLMRRTNNQWFVEGLVSFGGKCGTAGLPGIYTRIASYIDWIHQKVRP